MALDLGQKYTDKELKRLEKAFGKVYEEASVDIENKLADFTERYQKRDAKYRALVEAGKMSEEDYQAWLRGQVFQGKQWKAKQAQITITLYHANDISNKMAQGQSVGVFTFNANYMSYSIENAAGADLGFVMYDSATVTRLIRDDPDVLPFKKLVKGKDVAWNWKNIKGQLTQGIIQGESINQITKRLVEVVPNRNYNQMKTHARTMFTSAQNAGRLESMKVAESKGIKIKKQWMATLDERTRWMHRDLDGQVQELDEPFVVGQYKIMYPADPYAHPSMVYNCRCTLVQKLDGYNEKYERRDNKKGVTIPYATYRQWEKKKAAASISMYSGEPVSYNSAYDYSIELDGYADAVNKGISKASKKVAELGSKTGVEHLYLVNLESGGLDYYEKGSEGVIGFDEYKEFLSDHKNGKYAFVHNHNYASTFSETDVTTMVTVEQIPVMIAVQNDSVKYIAERAGEAQSFIFDELYSEDLMELNKLSRNGKITPIERGKRREKIIVDNVLRDFTKMKGLDLRDGRK